jgi:thioredoxin reductase
MGEKKSIIIIGAGIAGLSAGCYARMNGYKTVCRQTLWDIDPYSK